MKRAHQEVVSSFHFVTTFFFAFILHISSTRITIRVSLAASKLQFTICVSPSPAQRTRQANRVDNHRQISYQQGTRFTANRLNELQLVRPS